MSEKVYKYEMYLYHYYDFLRIIIMIMCYKTKLTSLKDLELS